jgi:site-specific DNA-methyltransferase (adenine-specific)
MFIATTTSTVHNADCMEGMRTVPDKFYDLALVDPPYGIGVNHNMGRRKGDKASPYKPADWDSSPPDKEYFDELFRVSKDQVIWGANHFISLVSLNSPCWLMWDKGFSEEVSFAQFELAWTSLSGTCKKFDKSPSQQHRIHPTQKPVELYDWIYKNYLPQGGSVIDTHLGSGSNRISAYKAGNIDFTGYEIDKDYFDAQEIRYKNFISQTRLF